MNCEYCQSPVHIWFQCPKKPDGWKPARLAKKSTAARKDVPRLAEDRTTTASGAATEQWAKYGVEAGTQALPVDTNSEPVSIPAANPPRLGPATRKDAASPVPKPISVDRSSVEERSVVRNAGEDVGSTPTGHTKFDKKTWQRNYMSSYMAQYRAEVKAGKRVPKKREC